MTRNLILTLCMCVLMVGQAQTVLVVKKGDAQSLLDAVEQANKENAAADAERLYIMIPDGFYDLGDKTLTRISGNNIALIVESMSGTVIQN